MYYVYQLRCPISNEIKYVGKTSGTYHRFNKHKNGHIPSTREYCLDLKIKGFEPIFEIMGEFESNKDALDLEERITLHFMNSGSKLFNEKVGNKSTEEYRKKMCIANSNRSPISEETRLKMSKSRIGKTIKKSPNRKRAGPMPEAQKRLISESVKETKRLNKLSRILQASNKLTF